MFKNLDEKIDDIKDLIMCLEYLTMKLEELEDAKENGDKEAIKDIEEEILEYIVALDLDNRTLIWLKNINTKWVKGETNE